ncbi:MAG TPA: hypothetical protein VJQ43_06735, partial [Thermoplasmata archaeon]|nr:hypothetical protein [Thermoplasmata archaeon]
PFLATVTMIVVSIGVGIGMSVGLVLAYRLLRQGREGAGRSATFGSVTGLTPAMIALVTLGACCSTTAAATAGIGVVAQASGTTLQNVLANSWYLNVLQVGVLWVALIAQEQLLTVYGRIFRVDEPAPSVEATVPVDARFLVGATLRVVLLLGGVTWSLALAAEWTSPVPPALGGGYLVATLLEHLLPGFFAIAAALFAVSTYQALRGPGRTGVALRASLLVAGGSLALWVPAPIASAGVFGLGNELLGAVGFPGSWGAVVPPSVGPLALALRWGVQFAALGVFALLAAVSPERAFLPLQWTTEPRPVSGTTAVPSRERTASPSAPAPSSHDGSVSSQG